MQSGAQLHHAPSRDRDTGRSEGELGAGGAGGRAAGGRGAWGWAARLGLGRGGAAYVRAEQCTMVQYSVVQCSAAWCSAEQRGAVRCRTNRLGGSRQWLAALRTREERPAETSGRGGAGGEQRAAYVRGAAVMGGAGLGLGRS